MSDEEFEKLVASLPRHIDRASAANVISDNFFPVSHRTLERWSVPVQSVNRRTIGKTRDFLEEARRRLEAAPVIMAKARRAAAEQAA